MTANLSQLASSLADVPVLLLGDLILDRYLWGDVSRISPEAPVPVLAVRREEVRLGGAGSVIANLAALGARVEACGILGADAGGDQVQALLDALPQVDSSGVLRDAGVITTQKTRVVARSQQLLRIDRDAVAPPAELLEQLTAVVLERIPKVKAVLVSDYARGVLSGDLFSQLVRVARAEGVPVLVDPHPNTPFDVFQGATTMTPNRSETARGVGIEPRDPESIQAAAEALITRYGLDFVVVTLDRDGMFLLERDAPSGHRFPARARAVFDVAGAGDMVLTVLGAAIGAGISRPEALRLANVAAGWEVEQLGVVPLSLDGLLAELRSVTSPELKRKIVQGSEVERRVAEARDEGREIVFTNGCFDLLHAGHVHFLQGCRAKGDFLVVGLNTDESVRGLGKGDDRPVLPLAERAAVLAGLEAVDMVIPFAEPTPLALIERVKPEILCKGEDYATKVVVGRELVEGYGGRVELVQLLPGVSTTNIIARISSEG